MVLGLLVSCSAFSDKKKIEKCADPQAIKNGAILSDKNAILWKQDFADGKPDPLGYFEKKHLEILAKLDLKEKLKSKRYEKIWDNCEREFVLTPIKFKEKFLK